MKERKTVVKVRIVGEEYSIRTDASPEHTRAVADHVDVTIRAIMDGGGLTETHKAAILAALQITDELFKERAAPTNWPAKFASSRMMFGPCFHPRSGPSSGP